MELADCVATPTTLVLLTLKAPPHPPEQRRRATQSRGASSNPSVYLGPAPPLPPLSTGSKAPSLRRAPGSRTPPLPEPLLCVSTSARSNNACGRGPGPGSAFWVWSWSWVWFLSLVSGPGPGSGSRSGFWIWFLGPDLGRGLDHCNIMIR